MKPILYGADEQNFLSNGIGVLADCASGTVTEERNGVYECEFTYPITGKYFSDLVIGAYVMVSHDEGGDLQPFEIYKISKPINGVCTYSAWHLSYKLRAMVAEPFTAASCLQTMTKLGSVIAGTSGRFTFTTDKVVNTDFALEEPREVRSVLGGVEGSVLDVYGTGEYEWDRWTVKLWLNRGQDTDVTIRYGKNMTDLVYDSDSANSCTGVCPFWRDDENGTLVTLPEKYVISPTTPVIHSFLETDEYTPITDENGNELELDFYDIRIITVDYSSDFEDQPTVEQLRQSAINYVSHKIWQPEDSIDVNFVQLWNTEEYKDYAPLQHVKLCDTVNIYYTDLGVTQEQIKVVSVTWDFLNERYTAMTLGEPKQTLNSAITAKIEEEVLPLVPTKTQMRNAINSATKMLSGGYGGYVYWNFLADGTPSELMFLDAPTPEEAVNVLRLNKNGLGFSHTGINGNYDNAWTIDGKLNASSIFGGTLSIGGDESSSLTMDSQQMKFYSTVDVSGDTDEPDYEYIQTGLMNTAAGGLGIVEKEQISMQVTDDLDAYIESGLDEAQDLNHLFIGSYAIEMGGWDNPTSLITLINSTKVSGDFTVMGTKSRVVQTDNYGNRLLYALETPSPMFSDLGECVLDETGECLIYIDDIFSETVNPGIEYQVFLQKEGPGDCWVEEKDPLYFTVKGTPDLRVAWEIKAIQRGYETERLEEEGVLNEAADELGGLVA